MQPFENNKRSLPEVYNHLQMQPVSKKVRFSNDDDSETEIEECAQKALSSNDKNPPLLDELSEMQVVNLTEEYKKLPAIWYHANQANWDTVKMLLDNVSNEDLKAFPQDGHSKHKKLIELAALSFQCEIISKIIELDPIEFEELVKKLFVDGHGYALSQVLEKCNFREINKDLFDWLLIQLVQKSEDIKQVRNGSVIKDMPLFLLQSHFLRGLVCLNLCLEKLAVPISNEEFDKIASLFHEVEWDGKHWESNRLAELLIMLKSKRYLLSEDLHFAFIVKSSRAENLPFKVKEIYNQYINEIDPQILLKIVNVLISESCVNNKYDKNLLDVISIVSTSIVNRLNILSEDEHHDLERMLTKFVVSKAANLDSLEVLTSLMNLFQLFNNSRVSFDLDNYKTIYDVILGKVELICSKRDLDVSLVTNCLGYLFSAGLKTPESPILQIFNKIKTMQNENTQKLPTEAFMKQGMDLIEKELSAFYKLLPKDYLEKVLNIFLSK